MYKSGFVAIVGRPNVGKSTLLNLLVGQKVAIMSNKAQTTRNNIQGIYTDENVQVVFVDTPGIHKPKTKLSKFMNKSAYSSTKDADIIIFITNIDQKISTGDMMIMDNIKDRDAHKIMVLNKMDLLKKDELFFYLNNLDNEYQDMFDDIIPISAKHGKNVDALFNLIKDKLPEGEKYYPDEMKSDHPDSFIIKEIVREKILSLTGEEIPHSIAIVLESIKTINKNDLLIQVAIIVERDSQKGIIIGKHGRKLKEVGVLARSELEELFNKKVYLETFVKVEKNWRNREAELNELGYSQDDY